MGGFLGGVLAGLVVVAGAGVFFSLTSPPPPAPEVGSDTPEAEAPEPQRDGAADLSGAGRDADLVELAPRAPDREGDTSDSLAALEGADTSPADKPRVGPATGALDRPAEGQGAEIAVETDAPVAPQAPAAVPDTPEGEARPEVETSQPRLPAAPGEPQAGSGFAAPSTEETGPAIGSSPDTAVTQEEAAAASVPQAESQPEVDTSPAQEPAPAPVEEEVAVGDAPAPEAATDAPRMAALPQVGDDSPATTSPSIGTPVVPLTERGRAPEILRDPEVKPIDAHAAPFENPEDKPLMSILLIDDPESLGAEALADFPYPLTFAIDPEDPAAAEKMTRHRAAGFEVALLTDLPAAATPQDAETALAVWLDRLPETVALVEGTGSGFQGNRALSDQVTDIASGTGRGLVTQDSGLNTVQKLAARDGVPAAVVFRDFDGAGQTPTIMRRFLDQAAFRAGQEGAVIMLGRVRPDTISALLLWGLQDRASRVALAPISAVLTRDSNAE
ncbi:divergent polysaccharide deacetylase family protein [Lutimaribacter marinistellae]|uniref:Divergent polysaccharide deacetylase family protein n=1 Tax=Lutimaribacter marinistellae TaxID=1820329 RepID=A0ABV7TQI0_9RHOB